MNFKQAIAAVLHLFTFLIFTGAALFFLLLPYYPEVRVRFANALLDGSELFTEIGVGFLLLDLIIFFGFYGLNRGYYLVLKMGKNSLAVDEKILWQTIEPSLRKEFSTRISLDQIDVGRGKHLFFQVQAAPMSEEELEALLIQAEAHLEIVLRERFGYRRPFTVKVSSSTR